MIGWKLKTQGLRPIGLDIGHNSIKMMQLAMNGEHTSVLAADKVHIGSGMNGDEEARRSFVISAIKQMLIKGGFRGRNVVSCLPNDQLKITSLQSAETETDKIEASLRKEAHQRFGLDPERDTINYVFAGKVQYGNEIRNELILFAASDKAIRSHIAMLEAMHLRPVAIDTVPCALFRSFERWRRRKVDKEQTVVFVDIGSRFTTVVFGHGGEISFTKQIPLGGEKFNSEIASKLGISIDEAEMMREKLQMGSAVKAVAGFSVSKSSSPGQNRKITVLQAGQDGNALDTSTRQIMFDAIEAAAEELAKEILLCLRYYTVTFRGRRIEQAVFSGGEAYERILLNVLRRRLSIKIDVAQPLKSLDVTDVGFDSDRRGLHCEWAIATGLGLKEWEDRQ
jgi:type IV pilus assembly protein PilM